MNEPFYSLTILDDATRYEFTSEGRKSIRKVIVFYETEVPRLYTLTLADIQPDGRLDINSRNSNGDMRKILATVVRAVRKFLEINPDIVIGFTGSNPARTRLYQIAIAINYNSVIEEFNVWGITSDEMKFFKIGQNYRGFFISLKNVSIVDSQF